MFLFYILFCNYQDSRHLCTYELHRLNSLYIHKRLLILTVLIVKNSFVFAIVVRHIIINLKFVSEWSYWWTHTQDNFISRNLSIDKNSYSNPLYTYNVKKLESFAFGIGNRMYTTPNITRPNDDRVRQRGFPPSAHSNKNDIRAT